MFDDPRDPNRDLNYRDPYDRFANMGEGSGYGLPIALLAIVLIIGGLIAFAPSTNQQTAQNNPAIEKSAPAPAPVNPAPPVTAPKQ